MEIHVCVKQSVDLNTVEVDPGTLEPILERAQPKIGDFEMNAVEEAVRIKERYGGRVILLSVGHEVKPITLREALAIGADEAYVVSDPRLKEADSFVYANVLAALSKKVGKPDIIICGEASVDESAYQVGPRLAEALGVASLTHVVRLEVDGKGGRIVAERALEDGIHVVEAHAPLVATVGLEINTPRLPSLLMIRAAARKPINEVRLNELGLGEDLLKPRLRTMSVRAIKAERKRQVIEGDVEEVAEKLISILASEGLLRL